MNNALKPDDIITLTVHDFETKYISRVSYVTLNNELATAQYELMLRRADLDDATNREGDLALKLLEANQRADQSSKQLKEAQAELDQLKKDLFSTSQFIATLCSLLSLYKKQGGYLPKEIRDIVTGFENRVLHPKLMVL